jgi:hypothetical protein
MTRGVLLQPDFKTRYGNGESIKNIVGIAVTPVILRLSP